MTIKFRSREEALKRGIFYARGKVDLKLSELKKVELDVTQFGFFLNAEIYQLENSKGEMCMIATSPFRDGFDLWLIGSKAQAMRV